VHNVAGLAYERGSAGYSHVPQSRQGGTGTWRCLDSKRRVRASQARKRSLLRMASEENEADAAACLLVVAQDQPSWAEARSMTIRLKCDLCGGSLLAATRAHSYHGDTRQRSILFIGVPCSPGCADAMLEAPLVMPGPSLC
jgi:hypothetical protein